MRGTLLLSAVALCLLGPALILARWDLATTMARGPIELPSVPSQVSSWKATSDVTLTPNVLALIEPDGYLMRLYEAPGRAAIWLYVGVYLAEGDSGTGAHTPEVCYPSQGWEVIESEAVAFPMGAAENLRAQQLSFQRAGQREEVVYWFQPSARWPASSGSEQFLRIIDAIAGRPQYAFVRLSTSSDSGFDVNRDLAEFAVEVAPAIREALEEAGSKKQRTAVADPGLKTRLHGPEGRSAG